MQTPDVISGNRVIAEFMGGKYKISIEKPKTDYHGWIMPDGEFYPDGIGWLEYDTSWEWLMPVVEKIAKIKLRYENAPEDYNPYPRTFGMLDEDGNFMVRLNCAPLFTATTLIEATWLAVVDFIQSNTQQQNITDGK